MNLNCWQDSSHLVGWIDFDFAMAEIYKCCWLWIPCLESLGHVNMENAFDAHCINQYISYNFVCTVGHFQSDFSFATDPVFQIGVCRHMQYLITFSDRTFRCFGWVCSPTPPLTLPPRRNPLRDLPAQRRWRCGSGGGDAHVPRRCSQRGTRTSACWSRQCCSTRYVNAHLPFQLNPTCIGTECADPRNIWLLSLTEHPDVSVGLLRHHSAAPLGQSMYILYQPFTYHFN